jgi:hypothetical protein
MGMSAWLALLVGVVLSLSVPGPSEGASAVTLLPPEKAGEIVTVRNVTVKDDGEISGEIVNNSKNAVRDVELQILYSWRWKDEFHPGKDDPGMAVYHTVDKGIPPGQSVRFTYKPPKPLPKRNDGHFEISVSVAGFAQVIPQS